MPRWTWIGPLLVVLSMTPAAAAGPYFGVSAGETSYDVSDVGGRFSIDDTAVKVFAGWNVRPTFGIEVSYADLGSEDTALGLRAEVDATVIGAHAVGRLPVAPGWSVFAKAGAVQWDTEVSVDDGTTRRTADDDGTEFSWAFGVQVKLTERVAARAEWETYGDLGDAEDVKLVSVGILIEF